MFWLLVHPIIHVFCYILHTVLNNIYLLLCTTMKMAIFLTTLLDNATKGQQSRYSKAEITIDNTAITREPFFFFLPLRHAPYFSLLICLLHPHEICLETLSPEGKSILHATERYQLQNNIQPKTDGDKLYRYEYLIQFTAKRNKTLTLKVKIQ